MKTIEDVDFLRAGFSYGSLYSSLRRVTSNNGMDIFIQASQDDGPNWRCKVYARGHEEDDFTLLGVENFEDYEKLAKFLSDNDGTNVTRSIQ